MRKVLVAAATIAVLTAVGCDAAGPARQPQTAPTPQDLPPLRLAAALTPYSDCGDFLDDMRKDALAHVGPYGFDGYGVSVGRDIALAETVGGAADSAGASSQRAAVPAPAQGKDYSGTNVQEAGVDEPDTVKTDGRRIVTASGGQLRVLDVAPALRLRSSIRLPGGTGELLLVGDRALVFSPRIYTIDSTIGRSAAGLADDAPSSVPYGKAVQTPGTVVTVVDLSDAASPRILRTFELDGDYVTARLVDGTARVVLRSGGPYLRLPVPKTKAEGIDEKATERRYRAAIRASRAQDWLPSYRVIAPGAPDVRGTLTTCDAVSRPKKRSNLGGVTVVSLDPAAQRPGKGVTVMGAGETVYASTTGLYVAGVQYEMPKRRPGGSDEPVSVIPAPTKATTGIHRFDIRDAAQARYTGSGTVAGTLLNQYSMSEYDGALRVATTTGEMGAATSSESRVTVLRPGRNTLEQVGLVRGLGKGERIFAVRFVGPLGYVVTFRQTDPLYVVDLRDPARPAVRGELKIPGYSAYLHPVGEGLLLGVGQDATSEGRVTGTQLSLFDVSDPAKPRRLHSVKLAAASSTAEFDPHAFLYWPATGLTVVPVQRYDAVGGFAGAVGYRVTAKGIAEVGRVSHAGHASVADGMAPVERSMVVGQQLLTFSSVGVLASDLATLKDAAWTAY